VQPSAGGGAAEAGDEDANKEESEELNGEGEDEKEEWAQGVELEIMERAAIREATPAKPLVAPDGKGRGRRFSGGEKYGEVDLRWLEVIVKEGLWGIGGRVEVILPSLAGLHQGEMGDLGETSARGYELKNHDGRSEIGELLEVGLTLGSVGVAGSVLSVLQRSGKEGTLFAMGTLGRGQLLKRLGDMELIQAIRNKKGGGGRGEGPLRTAPRRSLCAKDEEGFARAIGAALGKTLSVGTITVNQNRRVGQLLMEKKGPGAWNEESQWPSTPRSRAKKGWPGGEAERGGLRGRKIQGQRWGRVRHKSELQADFRKREGCVHGGCGAPARQGTE
jgi:hypothetical protein